MVDVHEHLRREVCAAPARLGELVGVDQRVGAGIDGPTGGRGDYVNYVVPGIVLLAIASSAQGTSIAVAMDMTEGIIARFRTMSIARVSVLTGHVVGSVIQTMIGILVVLGVALLVGFRPEASLIDWIAAFGILALLALGLTILRELRIQRQVY